MACIDESHRMHVVRDAVDANFRASFYAIVNNFVNQQRVWMDTLQMDPSTLLVYMIVGLASIQKLVRQREIPEALRGYDPQPQHMVGTMSRRAVAAASGMPRETVRRIVAHLLETGHLVAVGRSAVRVAPDTVRREGIAHVPQMLMTENLRMITELQRLGVLADQETARKSQEQAGQKLRH